MKKLTPEQKKLAEQYLPLAFKQCHQWHRKYPGYSFDDIYDRAMIGLMKTRLQEYGMKAKVHLLPRF